MKLISVILLITVCFSFTCLSKQSSSFDIKKLDESLKEKFADKFGFSVLIGNQNEVLWSKAYGVRDQKKNKSVNPQTLFNIASISKSITALGILKLVEDKKLKLSDSIGKFFENIPKDKKDITIQHLLTHKAGFTQTYASDGIENTQKAINTILNDKLGSEPGSKFSYSNLNYSLLALVIESVASQKYENFIRDEIFKPLGMKNTIFWNEAYNEKNVASNQDINFSSITKRDWGFIGGAGIFSTSQDLFKFWDGIANNKITGKEINKLFFDINFKLKSGLGIGNGWFISENTDYGSKELWTRGTESFGHNAVIRWFPELDKVIIVCTNSGEMGSSSNTGNRVVSGYIADFIFKND